MKYDLTGNIQDFDGVNVQENGKTLTYKMLILTCLLRDYEGEKLNKEDRLKRFELAKKIGIGRAHSVKLKDEDTVMIRNLAFRCFGVFIFGMLSDLLDNPLPPELQSIENLTPIHHGVSTGMSA